jgi:hypothetical protein
MGTSDTSTETGIHRGPPEFEAVVPGFVRTLALLALAGVVVAVPVGLHLVSQTAAILASVALSATVAMVAPAATLPVLVFGLLFQNLVVALVSPAIDTLDQFNTIRAYTFIMTCVSWAVVAVQFLRTRADFEPGLVRMLVATTGVLALVAVYFAIGFAAGQDSAIIYLRNIATPFLLFQIAAVLAFRHRSALSGFLIAVTAVVLVYGYLELFAHDVLFRLINGDSYMMLSIRQQYESGVFLREMLQTGRVIRDYTDTMTIDLFNTPLLGDLGIRVYRLGGTNFHPISYAYAIASLTLIMVSIGQLWSVAAALPLLVAIGSKGALALVLACFGGLGLAALTSGNRPFWGLAGLLGAYVATGLVVGLQAGDYHVIGFFGGLNGFLHNPLGHGIGSGGNLSMNMAQIDWSRAQAAGETEVAVESAVGVLLYQMGVFGAALLGCVGWLGWRAWQMFRASGARIHAIVAFALITILANGVFQEEALFAPLALGLAMTFAGLALGRGCRIAPAPSEGC